VVVAALDDAAQDVWLTRAQEYGWSRNELRKQIRKRNSSSADAPEEEEVVVRLNVDRDRQHRWHEAAMLANEDMADWIVLSLDRVADALLDTDREGGSAGSTGVEPEVPGPVRSIDDS